MKTFKYILLLLTLSLLAIVSCSSENEKNFRYLRGEWQLTKFYHGNEDLAANNTYILCFENDHKLWLTKLDSNNFETSNYNFYRDNDTLKIDITNSKSRPLDGNYNFHIDTLHTFERRNDIQHVIQLTFDSEDVFIEAVRLKNK